MASTTTGHNTAELQALEPDDARVAHHNVKIGDYNYHYLLALPPDGSKPRATVLLCHGWPDTSMTWRHQIPFLTSSLHLRVIAPDMLGYGRTSTPADANEYSMKKMAGHMNALIQHVVGPTTDKSRHPIILGGHDWGAAFVWRMAMWEPDLPSAIWSLTVPYLPPEPSPFTDLEAWVAAIPSLRYQLQLAGPEAESIIDDPADAVTRTNLRGFLNGIYDGRGPAGEESFSVERGIHGADELARVGDTARLMSREWVDYYVREFGRNSFHGPLNWYRTRRVNFDDERAFEGEGRGEFRFAVPAMVVMAEGDEALPPALADGMERFFEGGLRKEVVAGAGHWAHWEHPERVNALIGEFLTGVLDTCS